MNKQQRQDSSLDSQPNPQMDRGQALTVSFDFGRVMHLFALSLMVLSVAAALGSFFAVGVAIVAAVVMAYVFSKLTAVVLGQHEEADPPPRLYKRVLAGVGALVLAAVSLGLTASTLYVRFFAEASALAYLKEEQQRAQDQIDALLSEAGAASRALERLKQDSAQKAALEEKSGGSCPGRADTSGKRGPIAQWRLDERAVVVEVAEELGQAITRLEAAVKAIPKQRQTDFAGALEMVAVQNRAIGAANTFIAGSAIEGAMAALERRKAKPIRWLNGEYIQCDDSVRLELLGQVGQALAVIKGRKAIQLVAPAIDLRSPQETAARGLQRAYAIMSMGVFGGLHDDELLKRALMRSGWISPETLPLILAATIELCIVTTAFVGAGHAGSTAPFPARPQAMVARLEARSRHERGVRWAMSRMLIAGLKALFNLISFVRSRDPASNELDDHVWCDSPRDVRSYPREDMDAARTLEEHCYHVQGRDYVILPADNRIVPSDVREALIFLIERSRCAAWMLVHQRELSSRLPEPLLRWEEVDFVVPSTFVVSRMHRDFAHALRYERRKARLGPVVVERTESAPQSDPHRGDMSARPSDPGAPLQGAAVFA